MQCLLANNQYISKLVIDIITQFSTTLLIMCQSAKHKNSVFKNVRDEKKWSQKMLALCLSPV